MESQYSIDGGPSTLYSPPSPNTQWQYRRQFFRSEEIPYGAHTLVITNLGDQFWLDFVQVEVPVEPGNTQGAPTPSSSIPQPHSAQDEPTGTGTQRTTTSTSQSPTADSSSQQTSSQARSAADESASGPSPTLTPLATSSTDGRSDSFQFQASRSTTVLGGAGTGVSSNSLGSPSGSPTMASGAIIAVAVAGVLLFALVGLAAWWWRRRRRAERDATVEPFGEPVQFE